MTLVSLSLAGGFWISTAAALPPTWRVVRRQSAVDYSWWGFALTAVSLVCFMVPSGLSGQWLAFTGQAVGFLATAVRAYVKHRNRKR